MKYFSTIAALICLVVVVAADRAEAINSQAGTSAFSFLKIDVGARAVGMGGAFTGLADDEASLYYNPSGIAALEGNRVIFTYHNYVADLQSGFLGYIRPVSPTRRIGLSLSYLNYGDFVQTDLSGNITGKFSGGDLLIGVSFAEQKTERIAYGGTLKFIYEKVQSYSATGVAVDLGAKYVSDRGRWGGGLSILNLGTQLSALGTDKDRLPLMFRLGGFAKPRDLDLLLVGDMIFPAHDAVAFALGAEYLDLKPLFLRLGWNSFGKNYRAYDSKDKVAGLSFGFGVDYKRWQISYAYTPSADLGSSHRITLAGGI
ncbi:MAG: PorV/PorQ family protein [candidate division Zixibacteria bacterium]|nr:PorV/PorQ family protein [candidate division Zixibacteria bacterium]